MPIKLKSSPAPRIERNEEGRGSSIKLKEYEEYNERNPAKSPTGLIMALIIAVLIAIGGTVGGYMYGENQGWIRGHEAGLSDGYREGMNNSFFSKKIGYQEGFEDARRCAGYILSGNRYITIYTCFNNVYR